MKGHQIKQYVNEVAGKLNRESDPITKEGVVIVSIFGKSSYLSSSCKADCIDKLLGSNIFRNSVLVDAPVSSKYLCDIEGYYDKNGNVIYLHLKGSYDAHTLQKIFEDHSTQLEERGFLSLWADLKYRYARAVMYLFLVSHIIIITHPTYTFDVSYIHLFKILDIIRPKVMDNVNDILKTVPEVSNEWLSNGRLCSPRVLFYFEKCPAIFNNEPNRDNVSINGNIKSFEHATEDQIYRILKKNKIVGSTSSSHLFAIPVNQEFVFVETSKNQMKDWTNFCISSLINFCSDPNLDTELNGCSFGFETSTDVFPYTDMGHTFKKFIWEHVHTAFTKGFDDNFGRHNSPSNVFEVPKAHTWFVAANKLFQFLIQYDDSTEEIQNHSNNKKQEDIFNNLRNMVDTDQQFSKARCKKVFPLAIKAYQENSPLHYTKAYHESKVSHALSIFCVHGRGPFVETYVQKLEKECEKYWKSGRQMCEVLSLSGNPCNLPLHKGGTGECSANKPDESVNLLELPVMEHSSGVRYISACNCGRKQAARDDPFSIRVANYEFYEKLEQECGCERFEKIQFPVFKPSTKDYKPAQLFPKVNIQHSGKENLSVSVSKASIHETQHGQTQDLSFAYPSCQSVGAVSDMILDNEHKGLDVNEPATSPLNKPSEGSLTHSTHKIVIQVTDESCDPSKDKSLVRQASTTEYLPGMLHSESPASLLPQFPSWSLVCVGLSSLYSHNLGFQEPYNVGFISGSAYLLPWDVTVRLEHHMKERYWSGNEARNKTSSSRAGRKKGTKEFNVKIFIGIEYECPRGHRFMCSSPDKILKSSGNLIRDSGNKVTNCDMPLYFACPCRNTKPLIAQLMRIHIVTPKAPVYVTLNPRVKPAPDPCPIFITGCQEPLQLTQSTYWVLRLPYVYYGEQGPYIQPKEAVNPEYGRLLAGMYGIAEMPPDAK